MVCTGKALHKQCVILTMYNTGDGLDWQSVTQAKMQYTGNVFYWQSVTYAIRYIGRALH